MFWASLFVALPCNNGIIMQGFGNGGGKKPWRGGLGISGTYPQTCTPPGRMYSVPFVCKHWGETWNASGLKESMENNREVA
jgi:hypothetical protein